MFSQPESKISKCASATHKSLESQQALTQCYIKVISKFGEHFTVIQLSLKSPFINFMVYGSDFFQDASASTQSANRYGLVALGNSACCTNNSGRTPIVRRAG